MDLFLFNEGTHRQLASKLGAQLVSDDGGVAVLGLGAERQRSVSVIGDLQRLEPER